MSSPKERLVALLQKYDPEKVPKADALLAKYAGKEEAFLKQLEKKYAGGSAGDTPKEATPAAAPAAAPAASATPKDRLVALLKKHDPDKVPKADALLAKYAGKEEAFLKQLEKKYGADGGATATPRAGGAGDDTTPSVTPRASVPDSPRAGTATGAAASPKDRLVALLKKHDPDKVPKADALLAKYAGKEEVFLTQLAKKYGEPVAAAGGSGKTTPRSATPNASTTPNQQTTPTTSKEPAPAAASTPATPKDRLVALLKKHDPEKVPKADALLAKYAGKEEVFLKQLAKKYGEEDSGATTTPTATPRAVEPPAATTTTTTTTSSASQQQPLSHKERLVILLKDHDPDKVPKADALLAKYAGKEELFLKQLAKKYGVATPPASRSSTPPTSSRSIVPPATTTPTPKTTTPAPTPTPVVEATKPQPQPQPEPTPAADNEKDDSQQNDDDNTTNSEDALDKSQKTSGKGSNVTSGATTPRSTALSQRDEAQHESVASAKQQQQQQFVVSEQEKRKLDRLSSIRVASAQKFLETRINGDLRRNWFSMWKNSGQKKVAERIMATTKTTTPPSVQLVSALADVHMTPATFTKFRYLRTQLGLSVDQSPVDVASLTRYLDESASGAVEFVTVTYPEDLNRQQEAARAETQQLVGVLQEAQEKIEVKEKENQTLNEKLRFAQMTLEDAEKEIENLHQSNEAQARLTARANHQVRKLQDSLAKEQRGIPSELEQRMEQKDELASHLHKELASARSSQNKWKDQCEKVHAQLQEERDRRLRAEQRVEVLSVALVPPEKLGLKATAAGFHGNNSNGSSNQTPRISIAESVRNARENQQQHQHQHRDPSVSSPNGSNNQNSRTYQEQSRLLAAARKALITEGSATGGDVPRLLGMDQQQQGDNNNNSPRSLARSTEGDDNNNSAPPPSSAPPTSGGTRAIVSSSSLSADRAGLNQTPAVQGADNNTNNNNNDDFLSPSPAAAREPSTAASDSASAAATPFVFCPNCEVVQLTAFNGSRFSANPTDADKVAFCFSCRKTFSRIDLEKAEKNKIRAEKQRQQSVASNSGAQQQQSSVSKSRNGAAARNAERIPASLKNSVAKLQAQRTQKN